MFIGVRVMMNSNVSSLVYVIQASQSEVRRLSELLPNISGKKVDAILRALQKECSTLSSALSRLASHVDDLPEPETSPSTSENDERLLETVQLFFQQFHTLTCRDCGGVLPPA